MKLLRQPNQVAEEGYRQNLSLGLVQNPAPPAKKAHLCPEAGGILSTALCAALTSALGFEQLMIAPARATAMP